MKIIFDYAINPLGIPMLEPLYEWSILFLIELIAFKIAFSKVGDLYRYGFIQSSVAGSFIHWIIRIIVFTFIWAITYGFVWIGLFLFAHWEIIILLILTISFLIIIIRWYLRKKKV